MHLESVVDYLLKRGLVTPIDIVDGDLVVEDAAGRNANVRVLSGTGRNYFIKQARDPSGAALLRTEAAFYAYVAAEPRWTPLAPWIPRVHSFDDERAALVMHLAPSMHNVFDVDVDDETLGLPSIASLLGAALAACHGVSLDPASSFPGRELPWALALHRPFPSAFAEIWSAQIHVLRAVQREPGLEEMLDRLSREWSPNALVHGDVKFQNLLVGMAPDSREPVGLAIVDWETVSVGDRAWDVGAVFQSYLWYGVFLVSVDEMIDAAQAPRAFSERLPAFQRELRLFWDSYAGASLLSAAESRAAVHRAVAYAGVRLLQTAYELAQGEEEPGRLTSGALQLGLNILRSPAEAERHLIGIGPRT